MDETSAPEPNSPRSDTSKKLSRRFSSGRLRKTAFAAAVAAIIAGAVATLELRRSSGSGVRPDIAYQKYGVDGYPKPRVIPNASDPSGFKLIPSANPFEIAQQLLWLAAHQAGWGLNGMWFGAVVLPSGTVLYHAPVDSKQFMPANPSNTGKADGFVVPPGEVALIHNPRLLRTSTRTWQPDWIVATLASDKEMKHRATDVKQDYWFSLSDVRVKLLTLKRHPYPGIAEANVGDDGNIGGQPVEPLSVIETVKLSDLKRREAELGLAPPKPPPEPPVVSG